VQRNGWNLFVHPLFKEKLEALTREVERLAVSDPVDYKAHPKTKRLDTIRRHILEIIHANPNAREFRQGNTLGEDNRHWFRAKFHERFRLFYRFSSQGKIIIYAWINDELTLRKRGAKTDAYQVFQGMLEGGNSPSSFDKLKAQSQAIAEPKTKEPSDAEKRVPARRKK
jgi:toxin YhaV